MKFFYSILTLVLFSVSAGAAPPEVKIVSSSTNALEEYAASELSDLLKNLFQAEVEIVNKIPDGAENVILLGNFALSNGILKKEQLISISDQGVVLQSTPSGLIIRGGSPAATLWAVYEFGHSFGMRYLLHGDYPPIDQAEFTLAGFDTFIPEPTTIVRGWRAIDSGAAGQESWGLTDYGKLLRQLAKLKFNQVTLVVHEGQPFRDFDKGGDGVLWGGEDFPVSGETAGRSVFDGAKVFENPDFVGKEAAEAAVGLMGGIRDSAEKLGIKVKIEKAGSNTDSNPSVISMGQSKGGLLPQVYTGDLAKVAKEQQGFVLKGWIPGDLDMDVYYLSRASFFPDITPAESLDSLITPICGEGVAARLANGFAAIRKVSALIEKEDPDFAVPDPKMFMEHFESGEAVPEWWAKAKEHYGAAVNEMYRGNTRARGGARPFILYHAKRFTFALHYMTAVEHARLAGIARKEKDEDAWSENLELSVEAMHNALSIYAEVARNNSDRGVIAVLNKYAYRPLLGALDEAPLP